MNYMHNYNKDNRRYESWLMKKSGSFLFQKKLGDSITGFKPGGVCPFAVTGNIPIWLDVSMKRFEYVHPAGGNEFTSVKISPTELESVTGAIGWCDICKGWSEDE